MQSGAEHPLEVFYFAEGPGGERIPAEATAATLNRLDLQRAAIILGHRVQRPLAQRESGSPSLISPVSDKSPVLNPFVSPVSSGGDSLHPPGSHSEQQYLADRRRRRPRPAGHLHHHHPLLEAVWLREA